MDSETHQKIIRHHGWDYCGHERIRRFCPECKWDVPAYMRRGDPKHIRISVPADEDVDLVAGKIPAEAN